jgi:hypothetical protein
MPAERIQVQKPRNAWVKYIVNRPWNVEMSKRLCQKRGTQRMGQSGLADTAQDGTTTEIIEIKIEIYQQLKNVCLKTGAENANLCRFRADLVQMRTECTK